MTVDNFLPEEDVEFLISKEIPYRLRVDQIQGQERRGIEFVEFPVPANLVQFSDGQWKAGGAARVLVVIPAGYARTKLDSWYLSPGLYRPGGVAIDRANGQADLFGETWQFWSRHLDDADWRFGRDGLATYYQYIQAGLMSA